MTPARRSEDPATEPRMSGERSGGRNNPIGSLKAVMEGSTAFCKPYVPDTGPMNRALAPVGEARIPVTCVRVERKRQCASCGKGTHLQFRYKESDLAWRRCRKHLTIEEQVALFIMLTEAEVGN